MNLDSKEIEGLITLCLRTVHVGWIMSHGRQPVILCLWSREKQHRIHLQSWPEMRLLKNARIEAVIGVYTRNDL